MSDGGSALRRCSVGIMAFNEEANVGRLLEAIGRQRLSTAAVDEIIVVASGCTDRTEAIVREVSARDGRVKLLVQARREGKASAVNQFLSVARNELLVLESADTIPHQDAIERLLAPFADPGVGMTGARPRPTDSLRTFMGYSGHFLWWMHHTLARSAPKLGEMVAFRSFVRAIPPDTAVDEASIEAIVERAGYRIVYVHDALVRNKSPETIHDYLVQRRRVVAGHKHLKRTQSYCVSSTRPDLVLRVLWHKWRMHVRAIARLARRRRVRLLLFFAWRHCVLVCYAAGAIGLEAIGNLLGAWDYYVKKRTHVVWEIAPSTKRLGQLHAPSGRAD